MRLAIILTSGCLLILIFYNGAVLGDFTTKEISEDDYLRRSLFVNYNKFIRPLHYGSPTNITIGFTVSHADIDELKGKITVHGWLRMQWQDDKLQWNEWKYGEVGSMYVVTDDIWRPDLTLFNSANDRDGKLAFGKVKLYKSGSVFWSSPVDFTVFCHLDLQLWPFDTHQCFLQVGSWSVTEQHFDFYAGPDEPNLFVENNEWEISQPFTVFEYNDYCNSVRFNIHLVRRAAMYKTMVFVPAPYIILMLLSSFWLSSQMGERLLINGLVIVVITAFLKYFSKLVPVLAENTPLVVLFYSKILLLVSISTIISVIVLFLSSAKHGRSVPPFLRNLLKGPLRYILCLPQLNAETDRQEPTQKELTDQNSETQADCEDLQRISAATIVSIQFDWIVLATAVDRIFFLVYSTVFIVLAIVYKDQVYTIYVN